MSEPATLSIGARILAHYIDQSLQMIEADTGPHAAFWAGMLLAYWIEQDACLGPILEEVILDDGPMPGPRLTEMLAHLREAILRAQQEERAIDGGTETT